MITRLTLENFYSVRDRLEIDLTVSGNVPDERERFGPHFPGSEARAPKAIAVYGPNAAGKSTILKALSFIGAFIEHSFSSAPSEPIFCHRFNNVPYRNGSMHIGIEFGAPSILDVSDKKCEHCRYSYYLILRGGEGDQPVEVAQESLSYWPPGKKRTKLFEREGNRVISGARSFALQGLSRALTRVIRPNVSLISTLAQLGHPASIWLRRFAGQIQTNIYTERYEPHEGWVSQQYYEDEKLHRAINREIQKLDLGIKEILLDDVTKGENYPRARFVHNGLYEALPIAQESHGTRQFFRIFPMIGRVLDNGGIAVIDELDNSIHPLLLPELVRWFYDETRNPKNAQIWFTCQNPWLLQSLSKDEIILCEKDRKGCTTAFPLNSLRSVRRVDNFWKRYLGGAYGAVPHIG